MLAAAIWLLVVANILFYSSGGFWYFSHARLWTLWAVGRAASCSASEAMASTTFADGLLAAQNRHSAALRKLSADGSLSLWQSAAGRWWVPSRDGDSFAHLLAEQELRIYGPIHTGDVVLDAGANIGDFTRSATQDGAGLIVAVEIAPDALECLRRNLAAEIASGRVIVVDRGVWNEDSTLTLYEHGTTSEQDSLVRENGRGVTA